MTLHRPNIKQALQDYTLPTLHPDLQPYKSGDEIHHPNMDIEGGVYPWVYPRINKLYQYKQKQSREHLSPTQWQAYRPHLPVWERICALVDEETAKPDFPQRDPAYYELLGQLWTDPEMLGQSSSFLEMMLGIMYGLPLSEHVHHFMTLSEQQRLAELPEKFVVFRGHAGPLVHGISWTMRLDVALLYAVGNPLQSSVSVGIAKQKDAISFIDRWDEDEILFPVRTVTDIETYSVGGDKPRPWQWEESRGR